MGWRVVVLLAAAARAARNATSLEGPTMLSRTLLVITRAYAERLYLTERYHRWFGGVAYLVFAGDGPGTSLDRTACDAHGLGCFFAKRGGGAARNAAYAQLFGSLARATPAPPDWVAWRDPGSALRGVVVCHMDFWLQPAFFELAMASTKLDADRPWTLAAGLNRPISDDDTHFRVFGRYCLAGAALDGDADWNWGGGVKNEARGAVAGLLNVSAAAAPVCAGWADFFYAPAALLAPAAKLLASKLGRVSHEVAVPTVFRVLEHRGDARPPVPLDCWGCSQSRANDPEVFANHGCGHRTDLTERHVRDGVQALLDEPPRPRDDALDTRLAALDAAAGAWDGADKYWLDHAAHPGSEMSRWSSGCCKLPAQDATACNCVAHAPPTDAPEARRFRSRCHSPSLVRSRRGVDFNW